MKKGLFKTAKSESLSLSSNWKPIAVTLDATKCFSSCKVLGGITIKEFAQFINVMLAGEVVSQVYEKGLPYDITVRLDDEHRLALYRRIGR